MTDSSRSNDGSVALHDVTVELGGSVVLREVSLRIAPGEQVAFLGPSGAGKTTLLRLLNAMVTPGSGRVEIGGRNLADLGARELRQLRSSVGFVHQDLRLVPNLRVSQNVLGGRLGHQSLAGSLRMFLRPRGEDLERVYELLQRVGIPGKIFQRTDQLSGGEAQRVAVARALIQQPALLAADEPVASVDPARAREVLELLTGLCAQDGLTLCVSLHDPDLARRCFPRVIGLRAGRVEFDALAGDLTDRQVSNLYALEAPDGL